MQTVNLLIKKLGQSLKQIKTQQKQSPKEYSKEFDELCERLNDEISILRNSIKFKINIDTVVNMPFSGKYDEYDLLPYPICYYELIIDNIINCVLIASPDLSSFHNNDDDEKETRHHVFLYRKSKEGISTMEAIGSFYQGENDNIAVQTVARGAIKRDDEKVKEHARILSINIRMALNANKLMNCSNITYVDNPPSKSQLKKARQRGLPAPMSFKTLAIKTSAKTVNKNYQGGTHKSPAFHLRRGHIRHLHTGGTTWVQSCAVGAKKDGIAYKDYSIN